MFANKPTAAPFRRGKPAMVMQNLIGIAIGCMMPFSLLAQTPAVAPFTLKNGDTIAFLGNSFFERAIDYGHIETALALSWPEKNIIFRNLGWDGDTVYGHSRAGGRRRAVFGDPEEGFNIMVNHVRLLMPSVVFVAYGLNESFDGKQGSERFRKRLLRLLGEITQSGAKVVFLSPPPMEDGFGASLTYIEERNMILGQYRSVIADIAKTGNHHFIDLFNLLKKVDTPYSNDGIHPSGDGYRVIAKIIVKQLGMPQVEIDPPSKTSERIRSVITKKNALYFHRWRPRNNAFVYGERKSEQKIAQAEPAQFEPAIERQEQVIREMLDLMAR